MDCQDWTPITIEHRAAASGSSSANRSAGPTASPAKFTADSAASRKLADADTPLKIKTFTPASRQDIVARRAAMKKSQVELNQMCSFPPNTIREIEAGRLAPTIGQLNTLNRILKTGLKLG